MGKIKVLVVDDSALVRIIITDALHKDPGIEVVGTANNGKSAVFKSHVLDPDIITLDIEMPIMNGLDALKEIMKVNPKPVIMMSVLTQHGAEATFKALEYGAVDFIPKPSTMLSMSVTDISDLLISKVKSVAKSGINFDRERQAEIIKRSEVSVGKDSLKPVSEVSDTEKTILDNKKSISDKIVCIGTSTGGPSALITVFRSLPENFPSPVVVVQHMPEGFTKAFADRLNGCSALEVKEAEDGDKLEPGKGFIAPGHSHVRIEKISGGLFIRLDKGEKVSGHRPSIDVMFKSLNEVSGNNLIAVIMTGMGRDGADGILSIRNSGGYTVAQNEDTSVVYGMNRVAVEIGGVIDEVPLEQISKKIVEHL